MRILLTHKPGGAFGYITEGWLNAFRSVGHAVERWDGSPQMWQAFRPDLYIGCSGHRQPIPDRRDNCRVAIHVNPYGPIDVRGINESQDAISWTLAQRPDAVFGYGFVKDSRYWEYWTARHGIPWVPMATAADATLFNREPGAKSCGMVYLGGRWSYKAQRIDKWLLPVVSSPGLDCRLYGWGDWPVRGHLGQLDDRYVPDFLASGRVGPCISEPHTGEHGFDLPERAFKVAASGTVAVHDFVPGLSEVFPSLVVAGSPGEFAEACLRFAGSWDPALAGRQRYDVLSAHTYHHRLAGLLSALGFGLAAAEMQTYIRCLAQSRR